MRTVKLCMAAAAGVMTLAGCGVKDPIYETAHPEHGKVALTTDWANRTDGIEIPVDYTVRIGEYSATVSGPANTLDRLFAPGNYRLYVYNTAGGIIVNDTQASVSVVPPPLEDGSLINNTPGWLFTCTQDLAIQRDTDHEFTAAMKQQIRMLTLVIGVSGGTADKITGITARLSGVAGTLDIESDTHGTASNVALEFTKITTGRDAGKWSSTVRLLGITGTEQLLIGTIFFTDGEPANRALESDLSGELANFNSDKKTPLTLGGQVETPTGTESTGIINEWIPVSGGPVIAD